jgi:transketolase
MSPAQLDQLSINTIRFLSVDAVQQANSGHPGLPLGAAPMAYVLWTRFLQHNPTNPHWFNRDRFVLSAGHGLMLLYSVLYLTGYDLPLDQIKRFRQWGSRTPGHPERGLTPGVETTTGPLGQGFGNGVGMAIAEAYLAARYNRPGFDLIHHYTYGLVSDGDLMEGVAAEAASLAGHLKLGKLIYLYDDNHITLAAATQLTFTEDRAQPRGAAGDGAPLPDPGADAYRLWVAPQAGYLCGAWLPAGRGRSTADKREPRMARRTPFSCAGRSRATLSPSRSPWWASGSGLEREVCGIPTALSGTRS